ncbi:helix-turn-helix domain-containing protein [Serratia sp. PAMC26656]|uniref:helix-turn-helix domain-containing protein n=1 Tax=Serratia sp. PAMC26656 TaxID=2775909 RepID=UPI0018F6B779|nr:helix-turn-helix domain-containing protein [Serratia sp. PAMC26656]
MEVAISINSFDINFLSYMQENAELRFNDAVNVFPEKSIVGLKRSQSRINYYLPDNKNIVCAGDAFHCKINYKEYSDFINAITLNKYLSSENERITLILFYCFLYGTVNTSKLYKDIGVSLSTKKKDIKVLVDYLCQFELHVEIINRKGVRIRGNELAFRILIMKIIASICELNQLNQFMPRIANNPYERLMYQGLSRDEVVQAVLYRDSFNEILNRYQLDLSYPGKKFLLIYLMILEKRLSVDNMQLSLPGMKIELPLQPVFVNPVENVFVNHFINSLDHNYYKLIYIDIMLYRATTQFVQSVQEKMITGISHHRELYDEIYIYIQKCIIRKTYLYDVPDVNLPKARKHYPGLFSYVEDAIIRTEEFYTVQFDKNQIATLCLILKKFIMNSKMVGRNRKSIAIVTTSSIEKVKFFVANLRCYVDVGDCFNINFNEIYKLEDLEHFLTIVFSNRISLLLQDKGIPHLKINYYLQPKDIDKLITAGLSSNINRKINADEFSNAIRHVPPDVLVLYLKEKYGDHFA